MSYQVLARKWRPASFKQMAGQEHVLQALINALDNNRLHHAYLFTGTRGVGKTTIARILAKCLNCEQGVGSEPCGTCSACREIAEGRFVDLIEVDAASRTKVEDTRELLDNVQYAPTRGRFKVYLIDEVHMLSGHSFNALLKTLEEPPPHVKFLLATTDPQKLPVTVLSRCLQFNLKNLSPERIVKYLQEVLEKELVPMEDAALWALARSADGSMRDALSLTDQAIAHGGGKITETEVAAMLGSVDLSVVQDLAMALANNNHKVVLDLVADMAEHAPDYLSAISELISLWHRVAVYQVVPDAVDNSCGDYAAIQQLAQQLSREDLQLFYQISLLGRKDIPLAPDMRTGFEMTLLRLLAFRPQLQSDRDPPQARQAASGGEPVPVKKPEAAPAAAAVPKRVEGAGEPDTKTRETITPEESGEGDEVLESPRRATADLTGRGPAGSRALEASFPEADPEPDNARQNLQAGKISLAGLSPGNWIALFQQLTLGGLLQNTAANLVLTANDNGLLRFVLDRDFSHLYEEQHQQKLAAVLGEYFGVELAVEIEVGEVTGETPRAYRERKAAERRAEAVVVLQNDPNIKKLQESFSAELVESSVKPVD